MHNVLSINAFAANACVFKWKSVDECVFFLLHLIYVKIWCLNLDLNSHRANRRRYMNVKAHGNVRMSKQTREWDKEWMPERSKPVSNIITDTSECVSDTHTHQTEKQIVNSRNCMRKSIHLHTHTITLNLESNRVQRGSQMIHTNWGVSQISTEFVHFVFIFIHLNI